MKTEELVTLTEDVPIEQWRDAVSREGFWLAMRRKIATRVTEQRPGWSLADGREDRYVLYVRRVPGRYFADDATVTECTAEHAESARLRLSCWAAGR